VASGGLGRTDHRGPSFRRSVPSEAQGLKTLALTSDLVPENDVDNRSRGTSGLERAQKIQDVLLLWLAQLVEAIDDTRGLRRFEMGIGAASVSVNRRKEIGRSTVVKKEDPLPESPERRRPKLVRTCIPLHDIVGESRPKWCSNRSE
jgi:hypothetical protein